MLKLLWKKKQKKTQKKQLCFKSRALSAAIKEISVDAAVAAGFFFFIGFHLNNAAVTSPQRLMSPLGLMITCRGGSVTAADRRRLDKSKRIKKVQLSLSWDGCPLECVKVAGEGRVAVKPSSMSSNISQPLHYTLTSLRSSIKSVWRRGIAGPAFLQLLYSTANTSPCE